MLRKIVHNRAGLRWPTVGTVLTICMLGSGCGLVDGAGFGDEGDGVCTPPSEIQMLDDPVACLDGHFVTLPVPSDVQYNAIINKIESFGPSSRIDPDRFATAPISACVYLIHGKRPAEIAPSAAEWFGHGDVKLSLAQAETIVDLIETQGWCELQAG